MGPDPGAELVLGSLSRWRKSILEGHNLAFDVEVSGFDEQSVRDPNPNVLTLQIALGKCDTLVRRFRQEERRSNAVILTSDQVVVFEGVIREKPRDVDEARAWLYGYAEDPVYCHTSVVAYDMRDNVFVTGTEVAVCTFKPSLVDVIEPLLAEGLVLEASGGFVHESPVVREHVASRSRLNEEALQRRYGAIARRVDHDAAVASSISGMPLQLTMYLLDRLGHADTFCKK